MLIFRFWRPKVGYGGGESKKWRFILSWRLKEQKNEQENQLAKSLQTPLPLLVSQVVHSLHISSHMEKKAQLAFHKQVILIRAASEGLITLKGVLIIHS